MTAAPLVLRNVRRLEWYIRVSAYVVVGAGLFGFLLELVGAVGPARMLPVVTVLILVHVAGNIVVLHQNMSAMQRGARLAALRSRTGVVLLVGALAGVTAAALSLVPGTVSGLNLCLVVGMGLAGSITPLLTWRKMLLAATAVVVINLAVAAISLGAEPSFVAGYSIGLTIGVLFFVSTLWLSAWMLRVLSELDELRQTAPQLAVAEERLRFSRDLHDTFGRTLSVVAVKSELAAELSRRGRSEEAAVEIAEVRRIAEEAGREVRAVASGYRRPDLGRELDGARSVLESAGIHCEVSRTDQPPGEAVSVTLGWVVREAVTNVLRHSDASTCWVQVGSRAGTVVLRIVNDGAPDLSVAARSGHGNGLIGLTERVQLAGGDLTHQQADGWFTLCVTLPDFSARASIHRVVS